MYCSMLRKNLVVFSIVGICLLFASCRGAFTETKVDTTPPGEVRNVAITDVSTNSCFLSWINPPNLDFTGVEIIIGVKGSSDEPIVIKVQGLSPNQNASFEITGLKPDIEYIIRIVSINSSGSKSAGFSESVKTTSAASLVRFEVSGYILTPPFDPVITEYTLEVPSNVLSVTLYADLPPLGGAKITGGSTGLIITPPDNVSASLILNLGSGSAVGEVRTFSNDTLYSNTYTLTVTRKGDVNIGTGEEDINIKIDPAPLPGQTLSLSKTGAPGTAIISVQDNGYSAVSWKVGDGAFVSLTKTGAEWKLTLDAANYGIKDDHELTIVVVRDGISSTGKMPFNVSSAASLLRFEVQGYILTPPFNPAITEYTLEVPSNVLSVTLYADLKPLGGAKISGGSAGLSITPPDNVSASLILNLGSGSAIGEVRTLSDDMLYSYIYKLTVTRKGGVNIGTGEENISVTIDPLPGQTLSLSKTGAPGTAIISVQDNGYSAVSWKVDDGAFASLTKTGAEWKLTLAAANYGIKDGHELTIMVWRDGIPYSGRILFNVTL